ncbi:MULTISPECIES: nucleoside-diphosphate sugar epimerase/dehydratase [unclassified Bacillus (in: firmicutes)]|uniref:polysaccharide biosynthesis protein n=1 Tax=unclassified Bacillus (in: firmicutes) TaxID=185979 RepID=UPI0008EBF431|nr:MULTISPECIES: nucleoside-diphosphate sugar epimerase/dehydratase [unclassified Bacillus (in: firmicutes)]SFB04631.1 NDP-sugar epimerase, includes UDP-GlcNAc-inverting 4,6-dehydratase FlaA1 and capsular polysaccharide biosynthesis protein EpsC [Bacillus sp. UNCCL13]SFQ88462.1 NDP-sugar epimerase, includes UDP-GlcNAc-inverting 4,6-dehydratase FlaA1 and capsular polysaccharide biosynthesis protein EpsC [Bacillus sp. cl95]
MSYRTRLAVLALLDSILVLSAIFVSYIQMHPSIQINDQKILLISGAVLLVSHHAFAIVYRLYHKAWEYASIGELNAIAKAVTFSVLFTAIVQMVAGYEVYFRALSSTWMLYILLLGGSRFIWRITRDTYMKAKPTQKRALIIGAGSAGVMVARQLKKSTDSELRAIAFIDDDPNKFKLQILGIPVYGSSEKIAEAVEKLKVDNIIIAIPSLSKKELNRIFEECSKTKVKTQIIPMIEDIMLGKVSVNSFRDVQVEDLLGREPVELDMGSISEIVTGKTVMVTGAGGSIGSEICRQICKFNPQKIVLVGHGENSIYLIDMELRKEYGETIEIVPVIGDIQDRTRMFEVMEQHLPYVVYHAAAHKHVPLMEYNPREAVKNNIFGTRNVAEAADTFGVNTFVLISSDKAVNPPNVMGATKRFAEMIVQHLAQRSQTKFVAVRFGNVLGSRGSVIPLFKKQILNGGPVTVTHPDMTRYFMTIPEASRLVIQAGSLARGGEIFVLDMGEPVKILDLAKNLIKLSGYRIEEIGIKYAGIRPGEKMYEELLNENEVHKKQVFPKIHIGKAALPAENTLLDFMRDFERMNENDIRETLIGLANNKVRVLEVV